MKAILLIFTTLSFIGARSQDMEEINNKITVEVWSDVVCPFCYVGKKKLEKAINELEANQQVEVIWKSFQLDPNFPKDQAFPSTQYLAERKGYPIDQVRAMSNNLANSGKNYNIDFHFDNALTFNTFDAHRLIHWSRKSKKSNELKEAFMKAYFTEGLNLSKKESLLSVVASVGLDEAEAQKVLDTDLFAEAVQKDIYQAQQVGVRGVPFFLINNKTTISGAQEDKVFEKALKAELKSMQPLVKPEGTGVCLPNGECK